MHNLLAHDPQGKSAPWGPKLLELTEEEARGVEDHFGVSVPQAVFLLMAADHKAAESTDEADFDNRFPKFAADYHLTPAFASLACAYAKRRMCTDEEYEAECEAAARAFRHLHEGRDMTLSEEQAFDDWVTTGGDPTPSEALFTRRIVERGTPTTQEEVEDAMALAYLRDWARSHNKKAEAAE